MLYQLRAPWRKPDHSFTNPIFELRSGLPLSAIGQSSGGSQPELDRLFAKRPSVCEMVLSEDRHLTLHGEMLTKDFMKAAIPSLMLSSILIKAIRHEPFDAGLAGVFDSPW